MVSLSEPNRGRRVSSCIPWIPSVLSFTSSLGFLVHCRWIFNGWVFRSFVFFITKMYENCNFLFFSFYVYMSWLTMFCSKTSFNSLIFSIKIQLMIVLWCFFLSELNFSNIWQGDPNSACWKFNLRVETSHFIIRHVEYLCFFSELFFFWVWILWNF